MKVKKVVSLLLAAALLAVMAGCTGQVVSGGETPTPGTQAPQQTESVNAGTPVKTGLSIVTSVAKSADATGESDGSAQTNILLVAVTVGDDGVIDGCVIDEVQAKIGFDAAGQLTTDPATLFLSKNELGTDYGMVKASSIGKEWNEQAAALAAYAVGKTVEELKTMAVGADGKAADVDLATSVTLYIGNFISGIEAAVNNAVHLGARKGDTLALETITTMSKSAAATAEKDGTAQAYATTAVVTMNGETITSCYIDAVQANVKFDTAGKITSDLTAPIASKNQLGADYGMAKASSIGKEWNEQAAAFAAYVTGKTLAEVAGVAVDESGKAADTDLAASVTLGIGDFQALLAKIG